MRDFKNLISVIGVSCMFLGLPVSAAAEKNYTVFPNDVRVVQIQADAGNTVGRQEQMRNSQDVIYVPKAEQSVEDTQPQLKQNVVYGYPSPLVWAQQKLAELAADYLQGKTILEVLWVKLQDFVVDYVENFFLSFLDILSVDETKAKISSNEASEMVTARLVPTLDEVGETMQDDVVDNTDHKNAIEQEVARNNVVNLAFAEGEDSRRMCELSTSVRNAPNAWAGSARGAAISATIQFRGREQGAIADVFRRTGQALAYAHPDDMNGAIPPAALQGPAAEAYVEQLRASQNPAESVLVMDGCDWHADTNYTQTIDQRRTAIETDCYYQATPNATEDTQSFQTGTEKWAAMWAWFDNAFSQSYEPPLVEQVEEAYDANTANMDSALKQFVVDKRTVQATRSIAQNSFINLINRRMSIPTPEEEEEEGEEVEEETNECEQGTVIRGWMNRVDILRDQLPNASDMSRDETINWVIDRLEGGSAIVREPRGERACYGINERANPTVNCDTLTRQQAVDIYRRNYWSSSFDGMSPEMRMIAFDMRVNGWDPRITGTTIEEAVAAANGDPDELLRMREDYYNELARRNPGLYGSPCSGGSGRFRGNILRDAARIMGLDENGESLKSAFGTTLQEYQRDPSYEAQLEAIAKLKYFNPQFVMGQSEEYDQHSLLIANAAESVVLYDTLQGALRREAILAAMLELILDNKVSSVQNQSRVIAAE